MLYTGCDAESSRIAFDKGLSKQRFLQAGVPTARFVLLDSSIASWPMGWDPPVVLKPARQGSSVGLQFVEKVSDWSKALGEAGIEVVDANPDFDVTHEKSMVVDEKTAFVKSLNWATKNLTGTRDYAITTTHPHGVREVIACFDADWHRKEFKPGTSAHLIWCPANGRECIHSP